MKRTIIIIICIILAFFLLFPKKLGTNGYQDVYMSMIYTVDVYKEGEMSWTGEEVEDEKGIVIEVLGIEVFNNVE